MTMCMVAFLVPNLASATPTQGYPANYTLSSVDGVFGFCTGAYQTLDAAEAGCQGDYPWDGTLGGTTYHHYVAGSWTLSSGVWVIALKFCATAPTSNCDNPSGYTDHITASCPQGGAFEDVNGLHVPGWCLIPGTDTSHPPCPTGSILNTQSNQCQTLAELNAKMCACVGDPISPGSGNLHEEVTDYRGGGPFPLVFTRTYNSLLANQGLSSLDGRDGSMGPGWTSNVGGDARVFVRSYWPLTLCTDNQSNQYACPSTSTPMIEVAVWRPDGSQSRFSYTSDTAPAGTKLTAEANAEGQLYFDSRGFKYVRSDGMSEVYQISGSSINGETGRLTAIQNPQGLSQTFDYTYTTLTGGIVVLDSVTVTDPAGRQMVEHFGDAADQRVMSLTVPAMDTSTGQPMNINYAYDSNGNLQTVTYQDSSVVTYEYNDTRTGLSHAMTGLKDASSNEYTAWSYDASGNAVCSEHAPSGNTASTATTCSADTGGVDKTTLSYGGTVTVTESTGLQRDMTFTTVNGMSLLASVDKRCRDCDDIGAAFTYDSNGFPQTVTDFNGNVTDLTVNSGLTVVKTEGVGTAYQRSTTVPTVNAFNNLLPEQVKLTDPSGTLVKQVDYCYNLSGGSCLDSTAIGPVWTTKVTDPVHSNLAARTTTYTYNPPPLPGQVAANATGLLLEVDGPLTGLNDFTTYTYYSSTAGTACPAGFVGNTNDLCAITDALGHITSINQYSAAGLPLKITDMNGVVTTFTYDSRGRLTSRTVDAGGTDSMANATTTYTYYNNGLLHTVALPITDTLHGHTYETYGYDRANRLTSVVNDAGESKTFTYTYDTQCIAADTSCQTYDIEEQRTPAGGGSAVYDQHVTRDDFLDQIRVTDGIGHTTTYQHDVDGNVITITDADTPSHVTTRYFDPLNRVQQTKDAKGKYTSYTVDALDHLTDVMSPRGLHTSYVVDAFGEKLSQASPDSGTVSYNYSNWVSAATIAETDALGHLQTFTYDALHRLLKQDNTQRDVTYTYDDPGLSNSNGRLTGIADISGGSSYSYDSHGNISRKTVSINAGGLSHIVTYAYDAGDNLVTMQFPATNGTIKYLRNDPLDRATEVDTTYSGGPTERIVYGISYLPYGPLSSLTYGNGLIETDTFDHAYHLTNTTTPSVQDLQYDYYDDGTVKKITDFLHAANTQDFGYDPMQRLVSAVSGTGGYGSVTIGSDPVDHPELSYDDDGNRKQATVNGVTTTYAYDYGSATNDRLDHTVTGSTTINYSYDAAGNTTNDGTFCYSYDILGRNTKIIDGTCGGSGATEYSAAYNGLGERVGKTVGAVNTGYVYDEQGHLIVEKSPGNVVSKQYIWLGDRPLAYFIVNINGSTSADVKYLHVDNLNTPRVMTTSTKSIGWTWYSDPWGTTPISSGSTYRPRFPGQYFDPQTGNMQNWFRDYDPQTGRYLQSDPIGLKGGLDSYVYTGDSPSNSVDPYGLYTCMYVISTHTLTCEPNSAGDPFYSSSNWVSGNNLGGSGCQDNPACVNSENSGPIPPGGYSIGPGFTGPASDPIYPGGKRMLTPLDPLPSSRSGSFETHYCNSGAANGCSEGCIANTDPTRSDFNEFNNDLNKESTNSLIVVPNELGPNPTSFPSSPNY